MWIELRVVVGGRAYAGKYRAVQGKVQARYARITSRPMNLGVLEPEVLGHQLLCELIVAAESELPHKQLPRVD